MDQWPLPSCSLQSQRRSSSDRFARSRSITSSSTRRPSAMGDLNEARILIVDDELANVRLLERLLQQTGYRNLVTTTDPRQVRGLYDELHPDLILLDLMMPHLDGVAVMGELAIPAEAYVPILVLTADVTMAAKQRALAAGAKDYLTKPFDRVEVLLRIKNLLDTRFLYLELDRQNRSLEQIVAERTQRLLQSEKVATMGSLLAGVAHELNNPLAVLTGHAHLLREGAKDESLASRAEKIQAAADRCARIVKNFLALARQRPPERGAVPVNLVIELPLVERATAEAARPAMETLPLVGARRVLVVDDEVEIAHMLKEILTTSGHEVDMAFDGAEGLDVLRHGRYDLILSDTKMPTLDGTGFYRQLTSEFPDLCHRIIFLTGDVLDRAKREFLESTGAPFLMKPFDVADVRRLVHRVLAVGEQGGAK